MSSATAYAQKPLLSELSVVQGMAGGQGYFDTGAGWSPAAAGTDPWGPPPVNPQNYSGGAMSTGVPIYATGSVPPAAHVFPPPSPPPPFTPLNYLLPTPPTL